LFPASSIGVSIHLGRSLGSTSYTLLSELSYTLWGCHGWIRKLMWQAQCHNLPHHWRLGMVKRVYHKMWKHLVMARKCGATNYVYSWTHMDANLANLAISKSYPRPFCQRLFGHFFHLPSFTQFQNLPPPYATPKCPQRATALWLDHARLVRYGCSAPSHGPLRRPLRPRRFGRPMAFGHWRYGETPYRLSNWSNKELAENEWKQHDFNTDQQFV